MALDPLNSGNLEQLVLQGLTQIESRPWAFQRAINQGRASPLTSPNGFQIPIFVVFHRNFDQKPLEAATKFQCLKTFSGKVVVQSTIERYQHFGRG